MIRSLVLIIVLLIAPFVSAQTPLRGDVNGDGVVDMSDISALVKIVLGTDSVSGGGEDERPFNPQVVATYSDTYGCDEEGMLLCDDVLYTSGMKGIKAVSYKDTTAPVFVRKKGVSELVGRTDMRSRGIASKGNYLYVPLRQNSSGRIENAVPGQTLMFEHRGSYTSSTQVSDNATVNRFFKALRLKSVDTSQKSTVYVYKGRSVSGQYQNAIIIKVEDGTTTAVVRESYETYDEAMSNLTSVYRNETGDCCEVDWEVMTKATTTFTNVTFTLPGEFDTYSAEGDITFMGTPDCSPSRGEYGMEMSATDGGSGLLTYRLGQSIATCSMTFWLKVSELEAEAEVPFIGHDSMVCQKIQLRPMSSDKVSMGLSNADACSLTCGEWYQVKCELDGGSYVLSLREKEAGNWQVVETGTNENAAGYNQLLMGLSVAQGKASVSVDNFYFDAEKPIDDVSYINGKLVVVDKNTFDVVDVYNLDCKAIDAKIHGNCMVVTCFYGFNVYDITTPEHPVLKYHYSQNTFRESQNCEFFEKEGRVYAFICNYHKGYTIVDVTDLENVRIAKLNYFDDLTLDGKSLRGIASVFDVAISYPYAYLASSTMRNYIGTASDRRGVMTIDLRDFDTPQPRFTFVPTDELTTLTAGDPSPIHIAKVGNRVLLNNADRGVLVFDISQDGTLTYREPIAWEGCNVNDIYVTDEEDVFINSTSSSSPNIFMYKGF